MTVLMIATIATKISAANGQVDDIEEAFSLLQSGSHIDFSNNPKAVVVVIGVIETGKTTLIKILERDPSLVAIEDPSNPENFIIEDPSGDTGAGNKPFYPKFVAGIETDLSFYDSVGYSEKRKVSFEIAQNFYFYKMTENIESVKIVVTLEQSALKTNSKANGERFIKTLTYLSKLLKQISLFEPSIILVVTMVENKNPDDEVVIEDVKKFLEERQTEIVNDPNANETSQVYGELIDVFLDSRIALFRIPDSKGPLKDNEIIQNNRESIITLLDSLPFTDIDKWDFGFTFTQLTLDSITDMHTRSADLVIEEFTNLANNWHDQIQIFLNFTFDHVELDKFFTENWTTVKKLLSPIDGKIIEFNIIVIKDIIMAFTSLTVGVDSNIGVEIIRFTSYIEFFEFLDGTGPSQLNFTSSPFAPLIEFSEKYYHWYSFLKEFKENIATPTGSRDYKLFLAKYPEFQTITNANFKDYFNKLISYYPKWKKHLKIIDDSILTPRQIEEINQAVIALKISCLVKGDAKLIYGTRVDLADLKNCSTEVDNVFVFASEFVSLHGIWKSQVAKQLIIIAPVVLVMDRTRINMSKTSGKLSEKKAKPETNGSVGVNGGMGGNFFLLTKEIVNSTNLEIISISGNGSEGQQAGDRLKSQNLNYFAPIDCYSVAFTEILSNVKGKPNATFTCHIYDFRAKWQICLRCTLQPPEGLEFDIIPRFNYKDWEKERVEGKVIRTCMKQTDVGKRQISKLAFRRIIDINTNKPFRICEPHLGGNGGNGTTPGYIGIVSINSESKHKVLQIAGIGGHGGKNGRVAVRDNSTKNFKYDSFVFVESPVSKVPGITVNSTPMSTIYNAYVNYQLTMLNLTKSNHFKKTDFVDFYNMTSTHPQVISIVNPIDLTKEIEVFLLQLHDSENRKELIWPLYTIFKEKIVLHKHVLWYNKSVHMNCPDDIAVCENSYNLISTNTPKDKHALSTMLTLSTAKLTLIKDEKEINRVVDTSSYLGKIINEFGNNRTRNDTAFDIEDEVGDYKNHIFNLSLIANKTVSLGIEPLIYNFEARLKLSAIEHIEIIEKEKNDSTEYIQAAEEFKKDIILNFVLDCFNVSSSITSLFLSESSTFVSLAQSTALFKEAVTENAVNDSKEIFPSLIIKIKELMKKMTKWNNEYNKNVMTEIDSRIGSVKTLTTSLSADKKLEKNEILKLVSDYELLKREKLIDHLAVFDKVLEIHDHINRLDPIYYDEELLENNFSEENQNHKVKRSTISSSNEDSSKESKDFNDIAIIEQLQKIGRALRVLNSGVGIVTLIVDNKHEIKKANEILEEAYKKFPEENCKITLITKVFQIVKEIESAIENLGKDPDYTEFIKFSSFSLNLKMTLEKVRLFLGTEVNQLDSELENDVIHVGNTLGNVIDTTRIIHKMIDKFQSDQLYSDHLYYTNNVIFKNDSSELGSRVKNLDLYIESSSVLWAYNKSVIAFRNSIFPFGGKHAKSFEIPNTIVYNNTAVKLIGTSKKNIDKLKNIIKQDKLKMNKRVNGEIHFVDFNYNKTGNPFYFWDGSAFQWQVDKLLAGNSIVLHASIEESPADMDAVMFSVVNFAISSLNSSLAQELETELLFFRIDLTHSGVNYYRVGNKMYMITNPSINFRYSFYKCEGIPKHSNENYKNASKGEFSLSPFTTWHVQLIPVKKENGFDRLKRFVGQKLDMSLIGLGSYINPDLDLESLNLDQNYVWDKILTTLNEQKAQKIVSLLFESNKDLKNESSYKMVKIQGRGVFVKRYSNLT